MKSDKRWIKNTGVMPVDGHIRVDTRWDTYKSEDEFEHSNEAGDWIWAIDEGITHWRLSEKDAQTSDKIISVDELADKVKVDLPQRREVDTNPKKQFGDKSLPLNLWPALASAYGCLGLYNGKLKYGMSNFNATPVEASIYIAGAKRHLEAWGEGEEFDPMDGVPNLGGVLANIAIILEARAAGTLIDDRKLGTGYLKEREALKEIVAHLQELHKDKNPRHYTIQDTK